MTTVSPEVIELKPCPFCGGNAALEHEYTTSRHHSDYKDNYTVRCKTQKCFGRSSVWKAYHEKEEAISRWNMRFNFNQPTQGEGEL